MKTKIKILIAEHDKTDVELTQDELQKIGIAYESQVVKTESDYIKALDQFTPDIILSDYTFPSFDGPTAFRLKESITPDTPFIFLSGTIGEEKSIELIKNGVTDYCLKDKLFTLNHKVLRALKEADEKRQKQQIERELIQSEKLLARAQKVAHMGNWEFNFATNDISWSDEIFRMIGLRPNQKRQPYDFALSFVHPEDLGLVSKKIDHSRKSFEGFSTKYRIIQSNGSVRHVYVDSKLEFDLQGIATGLYGIIQDITETVSLEKKLAEERAMRLKEITDAVLTAQETERAEIGKELHDNLTQILGATKLYIELAKTDDELREKCLEKSTAYIVNVIEEIRRISKTMIIPYTTAMGLFDCIRILKTDLSIIHPLEIQFQVEGLNENDLGEKLKLNIYRIIQEQLNNIIKHSEASSAAIHLSMQDNEIILSISDNGKGFDTSRIRKGVGITNIMSRAEFFHGTTEVVTKPGNGYKLTIRFPFERLIKKEALSKSA